MDIHVSFCVFKGVKPTRLFCYQLLQQDAEYLTLEKKPKES